MVDTNYYLILMGYNLLDLNSFISIVARIALVKPEKARGVEDVVLRAAQTGQIVEKVSSCSILQSFYTSLYTYLYVYHIQID